MDDCDKDDFDIMSCIYEVPFSADVGPWPQEHVEPLFSGRSYKLRNVTIA